MSAPARPRVAPALSGLLSTLPQRGSFSLWRGPVRGEPLVAHRADEQHYAASMMKLALVIAAYRQSDLSRLHLDAPVTVHNRFRSAADGSEFSMDVDEDSDLEPWRRIGSSVALRWLCYRAIVRSSNLATNLVLEAVGLAAVSEVLADVGARNSCVTRGIEDAAARRAGMDNLVSAADLAATLQALISGSVASTASCAEIVAVMAAQQINDALPVGLPPSTRVAHKSGWVEGVSHDAGVIYPPDAEPYILTVCTTSSLTEAEGASLIADVASASWDDRQVSG